MWPRTCAIAERLWSDPYDTTWKEAQHRILEQRRRMAVFRNIHADVIQPEFCRQNDGFCYPKTNSLFNQPTDASNHDPAKPDTAGGGNKPPIFLSHEGNKELNGRVDDSEKRLFEMIKRRQVRNNSGVIKWTVFVVVLLILVMIKRRLVCAVVLKFVEYCRTILDAGGPHGPGMRMISIR